MTMNPDPKLQSVIATDDQYYLQLLRRTPLCIDHGAALPL